MYNEAYLFLNQAVNSWETEEEVRLGWCYAIKQALQIELHAERGRSDLSYNQVIIEFKNKGLFKGSVKSAKFKEAIFDRLEKYIANKSLEEGITATNYIGVAIDGEHISFAYIPEESAKIVHSPLMPLSQASVSLVLETLRFSTRRAVISANLVEDFGPLSRNGQGLMQVLSNLLLQYVSSPENNKIKMLFEEWKTLYGQVADLSLSQVDAIEKAIGFSCITQRHDRLSIILFVIHTYNSIIIKLLAAEIISKISSLASYSDFSHQLAILDDDLLMATLESDIEKAGLYTRAHIYGFVEEALFSWYIDAYKEKDSSALLRADLSDCIRAVLIRLSTYLIGDLSYARTNDILKRFYQNLVPDVLRKSLGEFYTPDWLVETMLDKVKGEISEQRFLDPTCGSASFLLATINRIRVASGEDSLQLLNKILKNVWGFDLNPLAVQTARLNYLMAIADLIRMNPGVRIEIPILLADAIYSPAPDPNDGLDVVTYTIGSQIADLKITLPTSLAKNRKKLDRVFDVMGLHVEKNYEYEDIIKSLLDSKALSHTEEESWRSLLRDTYNRVLALHRRHWNGIWFRIVRNYFWSSTAGQFNVIIGNPPWVRWSKLPELYRERVKPTCLQYKIFSDTPYHGGNELDISGMITYTVSDKWLKPNGQLLFLITQTHFQSASSQGFRIFAINEKSNLSPQSVEDLKALKPFPDAANKTAILIAQKTSKKPQYPVPYVIWTTKDQYSRTIPEDISKDGALSRVSREEQEAFPVAGAGSPWAVLPKGKFPIYKHLSGCSTWATGRKGITCDLNGIYFVPIINQNKDGSLVQIQTRPEAGKINIGASKRFWVEPDLLFPMIKGAGDLKPCCFSPKEQLYAIVPNRGIVKAAYEEASAYLENQTPKLLNYLTHYQKQLSIRSTYRGRMKNAPFYCVYNVGSYTFAPWKLVWAEQPGDGFFPAAVIHTATMPGGGEKVIIPDHKIYFVDFPEPEPAYYLCGLLQCRSVQTFIKSFLITLQVGDIFKNLSLPRFNPADNRHQEIAQLTRQAHFEKQGSDRDTLLEKIANIGEVVISNP